MDFSVGVALRTQDFRLGYEKVERNPPPLGMDSGSGGRNDGWEGRGRVGISCWRQSGG